MNRRRIRRNIVIVLVLLALIVGLPGWMVYREYRHKRLNNALVTACHRLDVHGVQRLLAQGADPNTREAPEETISFWRTVRQMLDGMRGRSEVEEQGEPVISIAASAGFELPSQPTASNADIVAQLPQFMSRTTQSQAIVADLVAHRGNIKLAVQQNSEIMHTAVTLGSISYLKLLLEHGANPNVTVSQKDKDVGIEDKDVDIIIIAGEQSSEGIKEVTPLMEAVEVHDPEKVRLLLQYGADVNARNSDGTTALQVAETGFDPDLVALLKKPQYRVDFRKG